MILDIWEKMYNKAKVEYHREQVSPFIVAHHVVSAVESEDGEIFTGFCIESASGVMNLCAERVAALNMYILRAPIPWWRARPCILRASAQARFWRWSIR